MKKEMGDDLYGGDWVGCGRFTVGVSVEDSVRDESKSFK